MLFKYRYPLSSWYYNCKSISAKWTVKINSKLHLLNNICKLWLGYGNLDSGGLCKNYQQEVCENSYSCHVFMAVSFERPRSFWHPKICITKSRFDQWGKCFSLNKGLEIISSILSNCAAEDMVFSVNQPNLNTVIKYPCVFFLQESVCLVMWLSMLSQSCSKAKIRSTLLIFSVMFISQVLNCLQFLTESD